MTDNHKHYDELFKEVTHPSGLQVVEASIEDLKLRQYNTYITAGMSIEEASAMADYTPKKA
jgi:hypothetical protein